MIEDSVVQQNVDQQVNSSSQMEDETDLNVDQNVDQDSSSHSQTDGTETEELSDIDQRRTNELRRTTRKRKPPEFLNYSKLGGEVSAVNLKVDCTNVK